MPSRFARSLEREPREEVRQEEHARQAIKPRRKPGNRAMARIALASFCCSQLDFVQNLLTSRRYRL